MIIFLTLLPLTCFATDVCRATPPEVPQGGVLDIACTQPVESARLRDRTVRLFHQSDGAWQGLMPIAAADAPGAAQVKFLNAGKPVASADVTILDGNFPEQDVELSPRISRLHNTPAEVHMLAAFRDNLSDRRYWGPSFDAPVPGCMVSVYGAIRERHHKPTGERHGGVDLRAPAGEPIRAAEAGTVKLAQKITVLGNTVGVDHGQGVETIYMHMSKLAVRPGAQVQRGDIVGYAGSTGRSTAPHLHWSVYVNGVAVNPSHWLTLTPCKTSVAAGGAK